MDVNDIRNSGRGSFTGTSGSTNFTNPWSEIDSPTGSTVAGNTGVVCVFTNGTGTVTVTGFTQATDAPTTTQKVYVFYKTGLSEGETSWTINVTSSQMVTWVAFELQNVDQARPINADSGIYAQSSQTSASISTLNAAASALRIAVFGGYRSTSTTAVTWTGAIGVPAAEVHELGQSGASDSIGMSVFVPTSSPSTYTAGSSASANLAAVMVAFAGAGERSTVDFVAAWGFEWGLAAGLSRGATATIDAANPTNTTPGRIFATVVGSPAIVTTTPRSGTYCLELASSSAAESVESDTLLSMTEWEGSAWLLPFRLVGTPAADLELYRINTSISVATVIRYVQSTGKIGIKVGTGTEVFSAGTVSADTWYDLNLRYDSSTSTHRVDWTLNQTTDATTPAAESQASSQSGLSTTLTATIRAGWATSSTATVRYDDILISRDPLNYPLGDHYIQAVGVDPSGTPVVEATDNVANFALVTNNATGATLTSGTLTNARDAIVEIPPTIGGTASGVCQINTEISDRIKFPMATLTAAPTGAIRAAKYYVCGWAAGGAPSEVRWEFHAPNVYASPLDSTPGAVNWDFDNSTTTPGWGTAMIIPPATALWKWSQAHLDDLQFHFGFSNDANPDPGLHSVIVEVVFRRSTSQQVAQTELGATIVAQLDPDFGYPLGYLVTASGSAGCVYTFIVSGTTYSDTVTAGNSYQFTVDAEDLDEVTFVSLADA